MPDPDVLRRVDGLPWQTIEGQVLVVVPKAQAVHLLNDTAARIWDLLGPGATVESLVASLRAEYEVGADEARRDVESVLVDMRQKGLLA